MDKMVYEQDFIVKSETFKTNQYFFVKSKNN